MQWNRLGALLAFPALAIFGGAAAFGSVSACEVSEGEGEGEGEDEAPCIIGDPNAPAEIALVYRTLDGEVAAHTEGGEVPLLFPPQGGQVALVGVRAKNITCRIALSGGLRDSCGGLLVSVEVRPAELVEGADGFGVPDRPDTLDNFVNLPVCPNFVSSRDGNDEPYALEVRVTETLRPGESERREHALSSVVVPVCAEPGEEEDCACECDADYSIEVTRDVQCPTIHDNDLPAGVCPDA